MHARGPTNRERRNAEVGGNNAAVCASQTNALSRRAIIALSLPALPMYALMVPLAVFLPAYYAESLGIGMAAAGTIFALGRVFDVVTDPFAGVMMDRLQHLVRRQWWLGIGAVPIALAVVNLFFVAGDVSTGRLFFWLLCLYLGWTLMSVALFSWAAETSHDYHERSRVMAGIQAANSLGSVLVLVLPVAVEWLGAAGEVGELRVRSMGTLILLALPVSVFLALRFGPPSRTRAERATRIPFWQGVGIAARSSALRRLLAADFAIGLSLGIGTSMAVFFIEIVLGHPGRAGTIQLLSLLVGLVFVPLWVVFARRFEKHRALGVTAILSGFGGLFALWVPAGNFALYLVGSLVLAMGIGGMQFLPRAIMADVLDHDRVESGEERAGLYYAFLTTTLKVGLGAGIAVAFYLADLGGFDPGAARATGEGVHIVRYITGVSSVVMALACLLAIWRFPLDREAQATLRRALQGSNQVTRPPR
ncbi:MAG: MFS transporter [Gammaproteobacteria bacterium]|nr:MFS transporter [Gammaproteobacteria bacterium]